MAKPKHMTPKQFRNSLGISAKDMAALVGVTPPYITMLEKGKRKPSADVAETYHILSKGAVRLQDFLAMQSE